MLREYRWAPRIAWLLVLVTISIGVVTSFPRGELHDFGSFVAAGQAATQHLNPYAGHYPLVFRPYSPDLGRTIVSPNLNPPISVLVFSPLAYLDPYLAFVVWYGLSLLLYLLVIFILARSYPQHTSALRIGWALSLAGFWHTLELGQIYVPLLLATTGALLLMQRERPILAGVLIGLLVAFKPNFAIWPVLLLLSGYWRVALAGLGTSALLSLLPLAFYPPTIYIQWLKASAAYSGRILPINNSFPGLGERLGLPLLGIALSIILLLALLAWAWHYRPPQLTVSGLALLAAILASPIAWIGYTLLLLPVLFRRTWSTPEQIAAIMIAVPYAVDPSLTWLPPFISQLGWYIWALVLLLIALSRMALRQSLPIANPPCPDTPMAVPVWSSQNGPPVSPE